MTTTLRYLSTPVHPKHSLPNICRCYLRLTRRLFLRCFFKHSLAVLGTSDPFLQAFVFVDFLIYYRCSGATFIKCIARSISAAGHKVRLKDSIQTSSRLLRYGTRNSLRQARSG